MTRRDPLDLEVITALSELTTRFFADYDAAAGAHGLSGAQARLLALVVTEPRPMSKLAVGLRCEPSNVTGLVDRLEKHGLVERRVDAQDRRVKLIAPTEAGSELSARVWADLNFAAEPLRGLEQPERIQLRDLLRKMSPHRAD
ncbi:MAG TPA: MarR family transcriptional regulator [Actinospica sp.]|jgi:DNA-binding MarR family transcriptional regulator|nr:MarR family transcriptional regulator [Actinospica sp.]